MQTTSRCVWSLPVPVISAGASPPPPTACGDVRQNRAHALRIGTGRLGRLLRAPKLRRGDHLHRLGDLLRRLDGGDPVLQIL